MTNTDNSHENSSVPAPESGQLPKKFYREMAERLVAQCAAKDREFRARLEGRFADVALELERLRQTNQSLLTAAAQLANMSAAEVDVNALQILEPSASSLHQLYSGLWKSLIEILTCSAEHSIASQVDQVLSDLLGSQLAEEKDPERKRKLEAFLEKTSEAIAMNKTIQREMEERISARSKDFADWQAAWTEKTGKSLHVPSQRAKTNQED